MSLELINEGGYRVDGRKPDELRRVRCRLGVFQQADGSAYIEQGNTKILVAVYGPHEPAQNMRSQVSHENCLINCEYSQAAFSGVERKNRVRGDRKGQEMSAHIKQTFEAAIHMSLYPRSQIDICIQVLQSDGSDYAVAVNASTLALIDAGITMKDYIIACSASLTKGVSLVDINHIEENVCSAEVQAAVLPKLNRIVYTELNGKMHEDDMGLVLEAVDRGCKDIFVVLEQHVRQHVSETAANFANS